MLRLAGWKLQLSPTCKRLATGWSNSNYHKIYTRQNVKKWLICAVLASYIASILKMQLFFTSRVSYRGNRISRVCVCVWGGAQVQDCRVHHGSMVVHNGSLALTRQCTRRF